MREIEKNYDPKQVEDKWYKRWQERGYFEADPDPEKEPFTIVIPPPNVTAALHMGHGYNNTVQDILIRWKRMQGFNALYQPGTDHAGIATQTVVERELKKEGKRRTEIGREPFVQRVWQWRGHYGGRITEQLKRLGISADWRRERFTLDDGLSDAVDRVFIELYEKGLIYRGHRIVNWDPESITALADDEVDHKEVNGKLYHIRYRFTDSDETLTVATTRPETLFGDTGVAVSPDDPEKQHLIGKTVLIPFVNRPVPIVSDHHVDKAFGSGFVKITPAHDPNDFEMGERHDLPQIIVLDKQARVLPVCQAVNGREMTDELPIPAIFHGLDRYEARKRIIEELEKMGQLAGIEDHVHSVGHSYRSKAVIEPYLSEQWFVKMKPMAEKALTAFQKGQIQFYPEGRYDKTYEHWLENIRDWCISRQLWWGHRIPVWYGPNGEVSVSRENPNPESGDWTQDPDVLDTWFSSWLWPFSTMGWPEETADLTYFYPTDVLVTASDIIFFWVARMIMAGLEFRSEVPFHTVYFNGIVRDAQGRKMSKSLGNGIDPIEVIDEYSADALRYTVVQLSAQGQDIKLGPLDFEMGRNFSNKIWNSFRFVMMQAPDGTLPTEFDTSLFEMADRWILSGLNRCISDCTEHLERYRFQDALAVVYDFFWHQFCDWYLELIKSRLNADDVQTKETVLALCRHVIMTTMQLLHPVMPFITEEIWTTLRSDVDAESIMISKWPKSDISLIDPDIDVLMTRIQQSIIKVRNIRAEMRIKPALPLTVEIRNGKHWMRPDMIRYMKTQAKLESFVSVDDFDDRLSAAYVVESDEFRVILDGIIDVAAELNRIESELAKKQRLLDGVLKKLSNERFIAGAPDEIVSHEREKQAQYEREIETLTAFRKRLKA